MDQNEARWFVRQGGNHPVLRKYFTLRWWLDQDTGQVASVMSHARKHGSVSEKRESGGIFWEYLDMKNLYHN